MKLLPRLFRRKKVEETEREKEEVEREKSIGRLEEELWPSQPELVFVGGSKGGAGKSFIAVGLTLLAAAYGNREVFAVDLDLDVKTMSILLQPPNIADLLKHVKHGLTFLNVGDALAYRELPDFVLTYRPTMVACDTATLTPRIRVVPAFNPLRERQTLRDVINTDHLILAEGVEELLSKLRAIEREKTIIVDSRPKSPGGIDYEPIYRRALEAADVFILVTEPPYLSFREVVAPYSRYLGKTVIVVNKVGPQHVKRLELFIMDARRDEVPVFIVPDAPADAEIVQKELVHPVTKGPDSCTTYYYLLAIAHYLRITDARKLAVRGCMKTVSTILEYHRKLWRMAV